jgi:hypothetical protein
VRKNCEALGAMRLARERGRVTVSESVTPILRMLHFCRKLRTARKRVDPPIKGYQMNPEDQSANKNLMEAPSREPAMWILAAGWLLQSLGFVLLPLVVYGITLEALGVSPQQFLRLPEFSFITIVLLGDASRKWIVYTQWAGDFRRFVTSVISLAVAGITIVSILLCLLIVAQYRSDFQLPREIYTIQFGMFIFATLFSACTTIYTKTIS